MTTTVIANRLERLPITNYQRLIFAAIATAWFFDCLDVAMFTFVLSPIKTEFHLDAERAGALASMGFVGMFIGAALAGVLADRFGRTIVFRWSIIIWGVSSLLCAFAPNVETLMLFRVFLGVGMAMELPVGQSLLCEFVPAKVRGRYVALLEGMWPVGFICAGLLAMVILPNWGWRGAFIAEAIPALFVLVVRRVVPESPRWLSHAGQHEKAHEITELIEKKVEECLAKRGEKLPEWQDSPQVSNPVANDDSMDECNARAFPATVLFEGIYRKRTIMVWTLWFFALLGYYGLTTWLSALLEAKGIELHKSNEYITLISLAGIPGFFTAAWLVEVWGRKPMMIITLIASAISAYFYGTASDTAVMICFGLIMQFFLFGMWSVIYAYTPELYPTHARATGAGFASSIGRVGALIGPYLVGVILPHAGQQGVFGMAAGSLVLAALAVFILGEETKGKLLEEI